MPRFTHISDLHGIQHFLKRHLYRLSRQLIATGAERTLRYVFVCVEGNEALVTLRFV
jgi:hypothetical protein